MCLIQRNIQSAVEAASFIAPRGFTSSTMHRRKPRTPLEEATAAHHAALEKLVGYHGGNLLKAQDEVLEVISRRERDYEELRRAARKKTDRAYNEAIDRGLDPASVHPDEEQEVETQWLTEMLLQRALDAHSGAGQRALGGKGKGVKRTQYNKKPIPSAATLLAEVQAMHALNPRLTFNDVCGKVGTRHGYKRSARSVKEAAQSIKWPDPRRRK